MVSLAKMNNPGSLNEFVAVAQAMFTRFPYTTLFRSAYPPGTRNHEARLATRRRYRPRCLRSPAPAPQNRLHHGHDHDEDPGNQGLPQEAPPGSRLPLPPGAPEKPNHWRHDPRIY